MTDLKRLMQFAKNYEDEFAHYMMYCAVEQGRTALKNSTSFCLSGGICYGDESNGFKTQAAWFIISETYPDELIKDIIKNFGLIDEEFRTLEYAVFMQNAISSSGMSAKDYIRYVLGEEDNKLDAPANHVKRLLMDKWK